MGFGFNYTWLSLHGYLTFSNSPQQFPEYPLIFPIQVRVVSSAVKRSIGSTTGCTITEKAPTRAFSWLKALTSAFTFKKLLRHYAKRALTPWSLNMKLGPRRNYQKGRAAIRHYANQPAHPF